jgi:hypothetical protein
VQRDNQGFEQLFDKIVACRRQLGGETALDFRHAEGGTFATMNGIISI